MKLNLTQLSNFQLILLIICTLFTLIFINGCAVEQNMQTAGVQSTRSMQKQKDVKIYPDIIKKVMHVKNVDEEMLDFYVFDLEGTLKAHHKVESGNRIKVAGLDKGLYVYQVFKGDEMSDSGKFTIK